MIALFNRIRSRRGAARATTLQHTDILQHVSDAVIVTDLDFRIQSWNKAAEKMYGWLEEEVIGKATDDILSQRFGSSIERQLMIDEFTVQGVWTGEVTQTHRDGTPLDIFASVTLMRNASGHPVGAVAINRDISPLKQAEQNKLNVAVERERIALQQLFMSDVAHDIRTPLTAIKLSLYLLRQASEDQRERHMQNLETQAERLEHLVEDLFEITRLDKFATGEYRVGYVDVETLLRGIVTTSEPFVIAKNLTVQLELAPNMPRLLGDSYKLERAFTNLFINALNYTPERGIITLCTSVRTNEMSIAIHDTGIGIPADEIPLIFERFYRVDKARGTTKGGLGLGLPIAQRIVQAHGGSISVASQPGAGSTFTVNLPIMYSGEA